MEDVRAKYVPPTIRETAFNCPHCGAFAQQFWFSVHANSPRKDATPLLLDADDVKRHNLDHIEDPETREEVKKWANRMATGHPFIEEKPAYRDYNVHNVSLSRCFRCNDVAIWIHDRLVWPSRGEAPVPNSDLPDDVRSDYEEAGTILALSPRGSAALLRLAIQKLCKRLGEKGENINDDIAALAKKGLAPRVQQALDVVRVVGNNSVHPGQIDLRDDRATAEKLFDLVNLIAEIMIAQPKHISEMYGSLPEAARKAIEKRDGRK